MAANVYVIHISLILKYEFHICDIILKVGMQMPKYPFSEVCMCCGAE